MTNINQEHLMITDISQDQSCPAYLFEGVWNKACSLSQKRRQRWTKAALVTGIMFLAIRYQHGQVCPSRMNYFFVCSGLSFLFLSWFLMNAGSFNRDRNKLLSDPVWLRKIIEIQTPTFFLEILELFGSASNRGDLRDEELMSKFISIQLRPLRASVTLGIVGFIFLLLSCVQGLVQ